MYIYSSVRSFFHFSGRGFNFRSSYRIWVHDTERIKGINTIHMVKLYFCKEKHSENIYIEYFLKMR